MSSNIYDKIEVIGLAKEYPVNSTTFKQFQVQEIMEIPLEKPDMEQIIRVTISGEILSTRIIEIPRTVSYEGQRLTGHKMIIEGIIIQKIEYIAHHSAQSIHAAEFIKHFSNFIMLEDNMNCIEPMNVSIYIEDLYVKQIDPRKLFNNVMILLNAVSSIHHLYKEVTHRNNWNRYKLFSQFTVEERICVPEIKPDIEELIKSIVEPDIVSLKFIKTMRGVSAEGQVLAGKKAVFEIKFRQKTLYVADVPEQSMHGVENEFYQSAYVVVPCYIEGTDPEFLLKNKLLKPKITIEDVFIKKLNRRTIFKTISVFLELQLVPTFEICYANYDDCNSSRLFIMYQDGKCDMPIASDDNHKCIKPQWSPMGNEIAYLCKDNGGSMLYIANLKNLKSREITSPHNFDTITSFCWTSDAKKIIFTASVGDSKDIYAFDICNSSFTRLTFCTCDCVNYRPWASPEGNKIAYIKSTPDSRDLWVMEIDGKNCIKLTEGCDVKDFQWSMQEYSIIYVDSSGCDYDTIYIIDILTKQRKKLLKHPFQNKIKKVKISPDNRYVAFIISSSTKEDLMICELATGELKALTRSDFDYRISDFVWKIDSSTIFYASKEFDFYNIYSIDIECHKREQLTNINSSFIEMSYRPAIR